MSQKFGNQFVRKPGHPGTPASQGLPSRPVVLPPKRPEPKPEAAPPPAPEPQKFQVKPGPIRVEIKKPGPTADPNSELSPAQLKARAAQARRLSQRPPFTKIFRWRLPDGVTEQPASVEVAGTFNHWQKIPLMHDGATDTWHVTVPNIPGHRTHHYMIFVNGRPAADQHADGTAVPHGPQEEAAALMTDRGPRVFMLFAQSK